LCVGRPFTQRWCCTMETCADICS